MKKLFPVIAAVTILAIQSCTQATDKAKTNTDTAAHKPVVAAKPVPPPPPPPDTVTGDELIKRYLDIPYEKEMMSRKRLDFRDTTIMSQPLIVKGIITELKVDLEGTQYAMLKTKNSDYSVKCYFEKGVNTDKLNIKQHVMLSCSRHHSSSMSYTKSKRIYLVTLDDCKLLEEQPAIKEKAGK